MIRSKFLWVQVLCLHFNSTDRQEEREKRCKTIAWVWFKNHRQTDLSSQPELHWTPLSGNHIFGLVLHIHDKGFFLNAFFIFHIKWRDNEKGTLWIFRTTLHGPTTIFSYDNSCWLNSAWGPFFKHLVQHVSFLHGNAAEEHSFPIKWTMHMHISSQRHYESIWSLESSTALPCHLDYNLFVHSTFTNRYIYILKSLAIAC